MRAGGTPKRDQSRQSMKAFADIMRGEVDQIAADFVSVKRQGNRPAVRKKRRLLMLVNHPAVNRDFEGVFGTQ